MPWNVFMWAVDQSGTSVDGMEVRLYLAAARDGRVDVLQWLRARGLPWAEGTCTAVTSNNHIECILWALDHGAPCDVVSLANWAAEHGHLPLLEMLVSRFGSTAIGFRTLERMPHVKSQLIELMGLDIVWSFL